MHTQLPQRAIDDTLMPASVLVIGQHAEDYETIHYRIILYSRGHKHSAYKYECGDFGGVLITECFPIELH